MPPFRLIQARLLGDACSVATALLVALPALAVTDRRSVSGAEADVGPAIPEPSSIILFLIGIGIVGYGVHRRRRSD